MHGLTEGGKHTNDQGRRIMTELKTDGSGFNTPPKRIVIRKGVRLSEKDRERMREHDATSPFKPENESEK